MLARIFLKDGRLRPWLRVLVYVLAALAAQLLLAILISVGYEIAMGPRAIFLHTPVWLDELISVIAVVAIAIVLRLYLDRRSLESLGITFRTRWVRLFALGVLFGAGTQLAVFAFEIASGQSRIVDVSLSAFVVRSVLVWFGIFLIAALAEEYPLRGYILQNLWEEFSPWRFAFWPAAILTSLAFALLHAKNPNFGELPWMTIANIAVDGMWACLTVLWTRSLWLAWGAHFAWNLFEGPILGAPVSGIHAGFSIVTQQVTGPALITGGDFGPEAGIPVLVVQLVGIGALYALYRLGAFAGLPDTREAYAKEADVPAPIAAQN
ncbi:MAG TPA: CPBP family intramembrane glutamic endopeptidase [Candidatus Eremiobacteraceae bacterium]|nr:CPBP family intramembrane glutamic endopeptidase [Candidatus Eremiobacteraceae bacterium]